MADIQDRGASDYALMGNSTLKAFRLISIRARLHTSEDTLPAWSRHPWLCLLFPISMGVVSDKA